jgi:Na+-transporting NADH:ubiquinone oxidoreductase subunit NqrB
MHSVDIRDYQILFLSLFLFIGIGTRDWTIKPELVVVTIVTALLTQWVLMAIQAQVMGNGDKLEHGFSLPVRSPLITSLGLCLLLRADSWTTMAIASVCAIASKFIFKIGDKHFFNPANFGIITALLFTPDAWVSPGQWGEEWWYAMLFVGAGGLILKRVGRWDTTVAFLGSYAFLEAIRNLWLGWTWDVYWHRLMSGSLLLFALFMVTDPRSIPNARVGRVVWAVCIAILTYILRNEFYLSTAVFWALFALAPLTVLFDTFLPAQRFVWEGVEEGRSEGVRE